MFLSYCSFMWLHINKSLYHILWTFTVTILKYNYVERVFYSAFSISRAIPNDYVIALRHLITQDNLVCWQPKDLHDWIMCQLSWCSVKLLMDSTYRQLRPDCCISPFVGFISLSYQNAIKKLAVIINTNNNICIISCC